MIGNKYTVTYHRPTKRRCANCGKRLLGRNRHKQQPPFFCLKCWPKKKTLDSEHKDDIFKARVQIKKSEYNGHNYTTAKIIEPFNEKLLSHLEDTGGNLTIETEKECLEEFLNDNCYGAIRGHVEGTFDMEILFYDYATGGDGGEREVVIEICKETSVPSFSSKEKDLRMGKYNKKKPERGQGDSQLYKRFCPKCFKVTYEWKCACGSPTRRMDMERTIGQIVLTNKTEKS